MAFRLCRALLLLLSLLLLLLLLQSVINDERGCEERAFCWKATSLETTAAVRCWLMRSSAPNTRSSSLSLYSVMICGGLARS